MADSQPVRRYADLGPWGKLIFRTVDGYRDRARKRRGEILLAALDITPKTTILDLGGEDGGYLSSILPFQANITVADINEDALARARSRGYAAVVIPEDGVLPFTEDEFDVVFSNSVIEHVTGPKSTVQDGRSRRRFERDAWGHQERFASEIRRVGKSYFVQTPNRWFPIEAHSWLPGLAFLPRRAQFAISRHVGPGKLWPKVVLLDFAPLSARQMRRLFPDAQIERERALGMTKSLMAVRRH